MPRYDDLSREELLRLLEARDRRDATRFGLVWEADEIERDKALNADFVALDLDPALCCGSAPWRNLIVEGDNCSRLFESIAGGAFPSDGTGKAFACLRGGGGACGGARYVGR